MNKLFDIESIRKDFPILSRQNRGKPLAYLDNAASSQKPSCVIDSISEYYSKYNSNVHRGVYEIAEQSEFFTPVPEEGLQIIFPFSQTV